KTGTTQVIVKPGEAPPRGETDWARVNAMTDEEVLAAALSDPDAQPLDSEALAKMRRVSRVKSVVSGGLTDVRAGKMPAVPGQLPASVKGRLAACSAQARPPSSLTTSGRTPPGLPRLAPRHFEFCPSE
ncbi:MAG TPA: hypothetical protein VE078_01485, partial [Thermoanaerobaculia bacterium]|nr:hypothetical protein [Thermoanaerobaculia bacterium]